MYDFLDKISKITREDDNKYERGAYLFVYDALHWTLASRQATGHITGQVLLEGIKEYAISKFGYLGQCVFEQWGVRTSEDIGVIVFSLARHSLLGKSENDSPDDFVGGWDFKEAFKNEVTGWPTNV